MAEINDKNGIKAIAYYLPQFHAIPENDKAWGKGFTEWTNTRKAQPMFQGHYQPREPLNDNYYNLLDDDVKIWQANLAKKYGVFGFCYYHYWFKDGKQLLEKPAEQMLINKNVNIPFCFSWANENWSKRWDGGNKELIVEQDYGEKKEWIEHFKYLVPFFKDERYITLNGKPVFLIYKPEEMPNVNDMIECWNYEAKEIGLPGICFMIQNPNYFFNPAFDMGKFDYQIKFNPFFALAYKGKTLDQLEKRRKIYKIFKFFKLNGLLDSIIPKIKKKRHKNEINVQKVLDYDDMWNTIIESESRQYLIEGAFVDWDNSSRKKDGYVHVGASPVKFGKYYKSLMNKIEKEDLTPIIFINAWNEWCEGAYLEPDKKNKYEYLEELYKSQNDNNDMEL